MTFRFVTSLCFLAFVAGAPVEQPEYPNCDLPRDAGNGRNLSQKFYFDHDWNSCFAFKFTGKGGNTNRFDSRRDCESACLYADGPVCTGPGKATADAIKWDQHSCDDTVCPEGYSCMYDMSGPSCCHNENSEAIDQGYADKCPDGSKAEGIQREYFVATFAKSCNDLLCGPKQKCQQVNKHFAKCCGAK